MGSGSIRAGIGILVIFILALLYPHRVNAEGPYEGYIYNSLEQAAGSVNGYLYQDSIDGYGMASGPFKSPQDLFVAQDDTLYIVDSGNNRIVHMTVRKEVLKVYGDDEGPGLLNNPRGMFVAEDGTLYVADTGNNRIALFSGSGQFERDFPVPDTTLLGEGFSYHPIKLAVDKRGYMIVVSEGFSQGLIQLTPDGEFAGFFGANHLPFSLSRLLVNMLTTEEQKASIARERPPEFSNLYQDKKGFIYTTSLGIPYNQVKRLSAVGVDTLNSASDGKESGWFGSDSKVRYGDLRMRKENYISQYDAFHDVTVSDDGMITALDRTTGKAYQYNSEGDLLFIFGGLGSQNGLFQSPVSIAETSDGMIYIADSARSRIDRFYPTPFSRKVHEATSLYTAGHYEQSMGPWQEVIRLSSNYELAYLNIGKALYKQKKFREAMSYFKWAGSRADYSKAFLAYRTAWLRDHFLQVVTGLFALYIAWKLARFKYRLARAGRTGRETEEGVN